MYVVFEGIDTSGKSTQIEKLCAKHEEFMATKEPGNTPLGENLRDIILHGHGISKKAEFFLFLADRAEHYEKVIKPHKDKIILSDRGFISGMAYAFTNDKNLDLEFLLRVNKYALSNTLPQKILFFETTKELLMERFEQKSSDSIEKRGFEYLLEVQSTMKKIITYVNIDTLYINAGDNVDSITKQIEGFLK